jgi:hypothetical protein
VSKTLTFTDIEIAQEYRTFAVVEDGVTNVYMTMSGTFVTAEGSSFHGSVRLGPLTGAMRTRAQAQFTDGKALWRTQEGI